MPTSKSRLQTSSQASQASHRLSHQWIERDVRQSFLRHATCLIVTAEQSVTIPVTMLVTRERHQASHVKTLKIHG